MVFLEHKQSIHMFKKSGLFGEPSFIQPSQPAGKKPICFWACKQAKNKQTHFSSSVRVPNKLV